MSLLTLLVLILPSLTVATAHFDASHSDKAACHHVLSQFDPSNAEHVSNLQPSASDGYVKAQSFWITRHLSLIPPESMFFLCQNLSIAVLRHHFGATTQDYTTKPIGTYALKIRTQALSSWWSAETQLRNELYFIREPGAGGSGPEMILISSATQQLQIANAANYNLAETYLFHMLTPHSPFNTPEIITNKMTAKYEFMSYSTPPSCPYPNYATVALLFDASKCDILWAVQDHNRLQSSFGRDNNAYHTQQRYSTGWYGWFASSIQKAWMKTLLSEFHGSDSSRFADKTILGKHGIYLEQVVDTDARETMQHISQQELIDFAVETARYKLENGRAFHDDLNVNELIAAPNADAAVGYAFGSGPGQRRLMATYMEWMESRKIPKLPVFKIKTLRTDHRVIMGFEEF